MKTKILALTLALVMVFTFAACGGGEPPETSNPADTGGTTTTTSNTTTATPATAELSDEPEEPQEPIITAEEIGVWFELLPDKRGTDPDIFDTIHSYLIMFEDNWEGNTSLSLSDIKNFTVYIDGTPNKITFDEFEDFGDEYLFSHYNNRLDTFPAIYTFSFTIQGVELTEKMLPAISVNANGTYTTAKAGESIPQPSTDGTRPEVTTTAPPATQAPADTTTAPAVTTTVPPATVDSSLYSTPQNAALVSAGETYFKTMSANYIIVRNRWEGTNFDVHRYDSLYSFTADGHVIYIVHKRIFEGAGGYDSPEAQAEWWYNANKDSGYFHLDGNILWEVRSYKVSDNAGTKADLIDSIASTNKWIDNNSSYIRGKITYVDSMS